MLWVDRTRTERVEKVFARMSDAGLATSTIDHTWDYLNQACRHALRRQRVKTNPVQDALLPEARPPKERKALSVEQAKRILFDAIPDDRNPAMWLTGLMCGLRPGELAGLRWPFVDIDSEEPAIEVAERAQEVSQKYVGQASPKTKKSRRRIGLHPLLVAALQRHRHDMQMLGLYDPGSFVFCTRNGTPFLLRNMRRDFGHLCERAGLGSDWTTYELRHSFVSLVADQLDDLVKVADLAGHRDPRTTQGYRHPVRSSLPHAIEAWEAFSVQARHCLVTDLRASPPGPGRKRRLVRPEGPPRRPAARNPGHACQPIGRVDADGGGRSSSPPALCGGRRGWRSRIALRGSVFAHGQARIRAASWTGSEQRRCSWRHQSA